MVEANTMKIKRLYTLLFVTLVLCNISFAQVSRVEVVKTLNYRQPVNPQGSDNYLYSTYYFHDETVYNLKGFPVAKSSWDIISVKYNPAGTSFAVLSGKKDRSKVEIFDAWNVNRHLYDLTDVRTPSAICYSADSKRLYVGSADGLLYEYNSKQYTVSKQWNVSIIPEFMICSPNDYYVILASHDKAIVINQESGSIRATINMSDAITSMSFNSDATCLAVLSKDGNINIYDTRDFSVTKQTSVIGTATSVVYHPDDKYLTVLTDGNRLNFLNQKNDSDRSFLVDTNGGGNFVRYVKDGKRNTYLSYNTNDAIKYKILKGLSANYAKMLAEELNSRMNEWSKMLPGETVDEYKNRVNAESRSQQALLYEQEIATRMADNLVSRSVVKVGSYNIDTKMLTLLFDNMPPIYITVPELEVQDFRNADNLEFRDAIYGLTLNDGFELIYVNVFNRTNGKTYEFNNKGRQSLDFLFSDDNFVPIELVQQSSLEDVRLQAIKDEVVSLAKKNNLISDHTHIQVKSDVVSDVDANGKRITNCKINFSYTVENQYSAMEDFAPGEYMIEKSHAAVSMLEIVTNAFNKDFSRYIKSGKKLTVKITGSADALKISGSIPYDGCYGEFENEPYMLEGELNSVTITPQTGIRQNEQLALMRAAGVKSYVQHHLPNLESMDVNYLYNIELAESTGGQYRRINIEFTFIDAF